MKLYQRLIAFVEKYEEFIACPELACRNLYVQSWVSDETVCEGIYCRRCIKGNDESQEIGQEWTGCPEVSFLQVEPERWDAG